MTELIGQIVSQLGVNEEQANGGVGTLFKIAQEKLGAEEFQQVAGALPGLNEVMEKAPAAEEAGGGLAGMAGSALSAMGGGGALGKLGTLATAAGAFKSLGLDAGMITKFAPMVMGFAQTQGGDVVKDLLGKVMNEG